LSEKKSNPPTKNLEKDAKEKKSARESISLTHVETQRQKVDPSTLGKTLDFQKEFSQAQSKVPSGLTNEKRTILAAFEKKRLQLERVWIIVNKTRESMGLKSIPRVDIKAMLDSLVSEGYLTHEEITYDKQTSDVYILTEKGEDQIV
jgi:DNA-binding MarR family transcriptional regulator